MVVTHTRPVKSLDTFERAEKKQFDSVENMCLSHFKLSITVRKQYFYRVTDGNCTKIRLNCFPTVPPPVLQQNIHFLIVYE